MKNYNMSCFSRYRRECMGFAMLYILFAHSTHFGVPVTGIAARIMGMGMSGVYIFLIMSGLGMHYALKKGTAGFFKKRVLRILPTYLLIAVPMLFIIDIVMDGKDIFVYLFDLSMLSFWFGRDTFWYVAIQLVYYLIIPGHDRLRRKYGAWVNAAVMILSVILGHVLRANNIESFGMFFQLLTPFIAGYWIADAVEKEVSIPIAAVIPLFLFTMVKSFFHVPGNHMLVDLSFSLFGLGICILLGWLFENFKLDKLRRFLSFFGDFTLEGYMMNVSVCWIAWRLKPLWEGKISIHLIYWPFCVGLAVVLAWIFHQLSLKLMKRLPN
ncbi:MAG: acyltransferase [Solobacterium sp.]|nr:acyltransferase [Solobacterium sp.]